MTKCKDCVKYAVFGKPGSKIAEYCIMHKPMEYVDVKNKTCKEVNCTTLPVFGKPGSKIVEYCVIHKPTEYVNVKDKTCKEVNCSTLPVFGKPGSKIAEYCVIHKPMEYVNVKNKTCKEVNCTIQPIFGKPGSKIAEYCVIHKPAEYVDIKNKTCKEVNCSIRPYFGKPGYSPEYCAKHKKEEMVSNPTKHKAEYITCEICSIEIHYSEQYCKGCKFYLENNLTRTRKKKEYEIKHALEENKIEFTHDLKVAGGCSKKRPDFVINQSWGTIIVEVDEFQHNRKTYSCECELTRMKQLYFDVGVQNLLFVRYNPDNYKHIPGQKKYKNLERKQYLIKFLKNLVQHDGLGVIYLFYDGFINPPEIEPINAYI